MTNINEIAGVNTGALNPSVTTGSDDMGKDTFINLLTTQMQNQDPLSPMDNQQFIQQLTSFSSLEQLMGLQTAMEAVYMGIASMNNASMANLLGTEVIGRGDTFHYGSEGDVDLNWNAAAPVNELKVTVSHENGTVVASFTVPGCEAGEGSYTWDGESGSFTGQLEEGTYTFKLAGTDTEGNTVVVEEWVKGVVTEMDYSTDVPQPSIQGVPISLSDIIRLAMASTETE